MLHLWCMATCCIVGLSHKTSDNQGTQCWWICDVGYNHACNAVLVPCYVLLIHIVVHYSLVSGAAVIFLMYGCKYGAAAWFGVDKSHLAKSHAAPPDWQAFLTGFRFFLEIFNCPYCRTRREAKPLLSLDCSSHHHLPTGVENPRKAATHSTAAPKHCISHRQEFPPVENRW